MRHLKASTMMSGSVKHHTDRNRPVCREYVDGTVVLTIRSHLPPWWGGWDKGRGDPSRLHVCTVAFTIRSHLPPPPVTHTTLSVSVSVPASVSVSLSLCLSVSLSLSLRAEGCHGAHKRPLLACVCG